MSRHTRFIDACYGRPTDCTPVWLMRQAGRYQASYRALRQDMPFFRLCKTPELAARVTVDAARSLGTDAAILFSDILVPVEAMGARVELTEDRGPVLQAPIRDRAAIDALRVPDPAQATPFTLEAARQVRAALGGDPPLIGFAGAPFTLASYLVEGGQSKSYSHLKALLFNDPEAAHQLLSRLADTVSDQLQAQVEAGCQAVQVFDSWAGALAPQDYRRFALPYTARIIEELAGHGVPRIVFATCSATLLELMAESGAEVVGVDWRVELDEARQRLGPARAVQGNLDPACLLMPEDALDERIADVLRRGRLPGQPEDPGRGHIFNLGHGVLPSTDEERVRHLVQTVHRLSAAEAP